jgi:hypothetical protein
MTNSTYKVFHDAVEAQGRTLLRVPLVRKGSNTVYIPNDGFQDLDETSVTPPLAILDHAQILREITTVYQSSVLDDDDTEERESRFEHVLDVMVDPAMDMCFHAGEEKQRLRPSWDKDIFVLNCLTYLQVVPFFLLQLGNRAHWFHLCLECIGAVCFHISETERNPGSYR